MITILSIVFGFYVLAEVLKNASAKKARRREAEQQARINAEIQREREERIRIVEEQRRIATEQMEHAKALVELAREQRLQAAEQEKQRVLLAKHEKRISELEFKMDKAIKDEEHWKEQVGNLYALLDMAENELQQAIIGGKNQMKYQKQIITLNNQIHAAEARYDKAKQDKAMLKRELEAA